MGCSTCQQSHKLAQTLQAKVYKQECQYDSEKLEAWKNLLLCVKENELYEAVDVEANKINSFLGIVLSAIRYNKIPCYFEKQLSVIEPTIFKIINTQQCP
jgi:hypothetical protein